MRIYIVPSVMVALIDINSGIEYFYPHIFMTFIFWIFRQLLLLEWDITSLWFLFEFPCCLVILRFFFPYACWQSEFHHLINTCSCPLLNLKHFFLLDCTLLLSYLSSFQILDMSPLRVAQFANIFSHLYVCLITMLIVFLKCSGFLVSCNPI